MSNVLIDRQKIDILANAISDKSGVPVTMTLDEMVEAVDSIETGGGEPNLQAKTYTVSAAGTETITADSGYDGLSEVEVSVPSASAVDEDYASEFYNDGNTRKWRTRYWADYNDGGFVDGVQYGLYQTRNAVPSNTSVTPTESAQSIGGAYYMMEGAVTVNAIPSNYVGSGITQRSSSDLTASGATVTVPSGYYSAQASKAVASGTAGTPTATKGTVSNHSISVTPSVTNTAGYISGGTINGTAVTVSASELVSGSDTVTTNDTYDVTNLAELIVNVSGGGSSSVAVGTKTATLSSTASSISFTGLSGNPTSFVVTSSADQTTGGTKVVSVAYDGTNLFGMDITTQMENDTGFTKSYSSGTLTITATTAQFQANEYKLVYTYGGSSSDIHTADVQVGSGATSITFSSLSGNPAYFSCVFKSTFSTSSGYQRVIDVVNDGTNTYGHAMDSEANAQTSWSYSYSGGSLTISSTGTNNGGYFHQPGYYQLTYAVDDSAPQYETVSKTYRASTSAQSETITPSSGYDAIEEVSVSIPAVTQTNLTAANIKSGTTISISNGQSNLWSVTGTYEGGGGSSTCKTTTMTNSNDQATSIEFTDLTGEPKWFFVRLTSQLTRSSSYSYYYVTAVRYNGTNHNGNYYRRSNGTFYNDTTHYSHTYSNGTLTVSSSASRGAAGGSFYNGGYELVYIY